MQLWCPCATSRIVINTLQRRRAFLKWKFGAGLPDVSHCEIISKTKDFGSVWRIQNKCFVSKQRHESRARAQLSEPQCSRETGMIDLDFFLKVRRNDEVPLLDNREFLDHISSLSTWKIEIFHWTSIRWLFETLTYFKNVALYISSYLKNQDRHLSFDSQCATECCFHGKCQEKYWRCHVYNWSCIFTSCTTKERRGRHIKYRTHGAHPRQKNQSPIQCLQRQLLLTCSRLENTWLNIRSRG